MLTEHIIPAVCGLLAQARERMRLDDLERDGEMRLEIAGLWDESIGTEDWNHQ